MNDIHNPLFIIPVTYRKEELKNGGGDDPPLLIDKIHFESHKRERVAEIDTVLNFAKNTKATITNPDKITFFEVEFHEKALAKSSQPIRLLDLSHITLDFQSDENTFYASATEANLDSFRDTISKFSLQENKNDCAYLSAISKVKLISKEDKLLGADITNADSNKWFLFFQNALSEDDCKKIFEEIKKKYETDAEFFITQSGAKAVYGSFNRKALDEISDAHPQNPVQRIEKSITFAVKQAAQIPTDFKEIKIVKPSLDAKVGIVDSGMAIHHIYKDLIIGVEDFVKNPSLENLEHGTLVGTRAMFSNDIEEQVYNHKTLFANVRVLDIKVMRKITHKGEEYFTVPDKELIDAIKFVLDKHGKEVKVYNLSLNYLEPQITHSGIRHFISRDLDALAYKYNVIFVVTAGNNVDCLKHPYPDVLFMDDSVIVPPADMLNGIVVGSIADVESSKSVAFNNEPSPFTRTGKDGFKKPDVVHFGGNLDKFGNFNGLGVKGFSIKPNHLAEDIGTSFAAPVVSQITAQIYEYLNISKQWSEPPIDLTKALLLHSSQYNLPANSSIDPSVIERAVGFGIPDFGRALDCAESVATFVFYDKIGKPTKSGTNTLRLNKQKIQFTVPKELVGHNKKVKIKGTLVYSPLINALGGLDYSQADIDVNLHYINSKGNSVGGNLTQNSNDYRNKWNPVKSFEKIYSSYEAGFWEVWLDLTTRGNADITSYSQNYALVISVEDVSPNIEDRINLHNLISLQHKEYLHIQPQQRIKTTV